MINVPGEATSGVSSRVIMSRIRANIAAGRWPAGSQLPTRVEMEQLFGGSRVTVQRALDQLRLEGWVTVDGRRGTFVSRDLPHLRRYALVFPESVPDVDSAEPGVRFWAALADEAPRLAQVRGISLQCYFGVNGHTDSEDYQRLLVEVERHRLTGIVFATTPFLLRGTPLLEDQGIPKVAIMKQDGEWAMPAVYPATAQFWSQALEYAAGAGRKRVGYLSIPRASTSGFYQGIVRPELGLESRPYWEQIAARSFPMAARNLMHAVMQGGPENRPDAFIIADDNLVPYAAEGVRAAGLRCPEDVLLIGHANYPHVTPPCLPMVRLGFEVQEVLATCLDRLDALRRGENVPLATAIAPHFDFEREVGPGAASSTGRESILETTAS